MYFEKRKLVGVLVLTLILGSAVRVPAVEYPTKPINLVVSMAAGGVIDLAARALANGAKKDLGQPVICENVVGGGGTVGPAVVLKKPADGYSLVIVASNNLNINWHMREMSFHPVKDVTPIIRVTGIFAGIVVREDSQWKTIQEFIQYSRQNPGKVSYGSPGVGTPPYLAMEELAILAGGIKWAHIPYKGAAETNTALLGGHIDAAVGASVWAPLVESGKFRLLATYAASRSARFPQAPTLIEVGYKMAYPSPIDILGPKGLPRPVVKKLHDAFKSSLNDSETQAVLNKFDMFTIYLGPEDLEKASQQEFDHIGNIVRKLGLQKK